MMIAYFGSCCVAFSSTMIVKCIPVCAFYNKHKYTVRTHKKSEGFTLTHATAVNVDELACFFHVSVGEWSYTNSCFYRIRICLELESLEQVILSSIRFF